MRLSEFPRPPEDTRIGVHWSPGVADAIGIGPIREYWIPLLKEMGVKWVKLLHIGALQLAEELLANGIMPVVRLYRRQPNSVDPSPGEGTLGRAEIEALEALVAIGVRYFEFNNEPDSGFEWRTQMPPDENVAMRVVARNAIRDMETILQRGAFPAIPAVSPGKKWDLMAAIIAEGGRDLLGEGVWWAIHNYDFNHPVNYPYDPVNQEGVLLTEEEYQRLGTAAWEGPHWGHRTLEFVNLHRQQGKNPGHTAVDDPTCWNGYEYFAHLSLQHLGYHIPILSTENGPVVGEDNDPRYPTTTPEIHRDKVVDMCRIMMGTHETYSQAPDYYFCTAFWILGNRVLGSRSGRWEPQAWVSNRWPGERLPVVDALRALPKQVWVPLGNATEPPGEEGSRVFGTVRGGAHRHIILHNVRYNAERVIREDETYEFTGVPAGTYTLSVVGTGVEQTGIEVDGESDVEVDLDVTAGSPAESEVEGVVKGGAGHSVCLHGPVEREVILGEDETFHFDHLPAGEYILTVTDTDIEEHLVLDGRNQVHLLLEVEPTTPGWTYTVKDGGPGPGFGVVRCRVKDTPNLDVHLWTEGWEGTTQRTGSKPEYGPDVCEFAPLGEGTYYLEPKGLDVRATVNVTSERVVWVEFLPVEEPEEPEEPTEPPRESVIYGRVENGAGVTVMVSGPEERQCEVGEDETYRVEGLPAGTYSVAVAGTEVRQDGVELDGRNSVEVNLTLPPPRESVIYGRVENGAGLVIQLEGEGVEQEQVVDEEEKFSFTGLPAGVYTLRLPEVHVVRKGIEVNGRNRVEVHLEAPKFEEGWEYTVEVGESAGFGIVRCEVWGQENLPVHLWTTGWEGIVQTTGSKPEYGPYACEFAPLGSGTYFVEPKGLGVQARVQVDGRHVVWVRFRPTHIPNVPTTTVKVYDVYLWPVREPQNVEEFLAILRYAARFAPEIGTDVDQAVKARHVVVLGRLKPSQEKTLRLAGTKVVQLEEEWTDVIKDLIARGQPVP